MEKICSEIWPRKKPREFYGMQGTIGSIVILTLQTPLSLYHTFFSACSIIDASSSIDQLPHLIGATDTHTQTTLPSCLQLLSLEVPTMWFCKLRLLFWICVRTQTKIEDSSWHDIAKEAHLSANIQFLL
jgi:hypothetical protein